MKICYSREMSMADLFPEDPFSLPTPERNRAFLREYDVDFLFEWFNAKEWIDRFRVERPDGSIDVEATYERVGLTLLPDETFPSDDESSRAFITGLDEDPLSPIRVHINPEPIAGDFERTVSAGHELGHYFLFTLGMGLDKAGYGSKEELFCELFGKNFALPVERLHGVEVGDGRIIGELMEKYQVAYSTVMHQLMQAGVLPRTLKVDSTLPALPNPLYSGKVERGVLCLDCELGKNHQPSLESAPVLDLTAYEYAYEVGIQMCYVPRSHAMMKEVNSLYGRWTEEDDQFVEQAMRGIFPSR